MQKSTISSNGRDPICSDSIGISIIIDLVTQAYIQSSPHWGEILIIEKIPIVFCAYACYLLHYIILGSCYWIAIKPLHH
uniref:Uncharacterized protein n=1 Tax=Arundo donax TaxID=35708 RepID=A0A0A9DCK9_ARUDO